MGLHLFLSILAITAALIIYTIGVWTEHFNKSIEVRHLVFFELALFLNLVGTKIMSDLIAKNIGDFRAYMQGTAGAFSIGLMTLHIIWALIVLIKNDEIAKQYFNKYSIAIWVVWLVPYILGIMSGMN